MNENVGEERLSACLSKQSNDYNKLIRAHGEIIRQSATNHLYNLAEETHTPWVNSVCESEPSAYLRSPYSNKSHRKPTKIRVDAMVPVDMYTFMALLKNILLHMLKSFFRNTGNLKHESSNSVLLCKESRGFSRGMFMLSIELIQFLFSEHSQFLLRSLYPT
jgi:hypothetical protein